MMHCSPFRQRGGPRVPSNRVQWPLLVLSRPRAPLHGRSQHPGLSRAARRARSGLTSPAEQRTWQGNGTVVPVLLSQSQLARGLQLWAVQMCDPGQLHSDRDQRHSGPVWGVRWCVLDWRWRAVLAGQKGGLCAPARACEAANLQEMAGAARPVATVLYAQAQVLALSSVAVPDFNYPACWCAC